MNERTEQNQQMNREKEKEKKKYTSSNVLTSYDVQFAIYEMSVYCWYTRLFHE